VIVADRLLVEVLAVAVNVTCVVPAGPVVLDAVTQLGSPDMVQPPGTFVVTEVFTVVPAEAVRDPEVGDNDKVAVAGSWVSMNMRPFPAESVNVIVKLFAPLVLAGAVKVTKVVPVGPLVLDTVAQLGSAEDRVHPPAASVVTDVVTDPPAPGIDPEVGFNVNVVGTAAAWVMVKG
jgi:hypothetical protein